MPIVVPYAVPPSYQVDGDTYGLYGAGHAFHYAKTARRQQAKFQAKAERHAPETQVHQHALERVSYYRDLEIQWLACAEKTVLNARKRLDQERLDRRNMQRMEREYGLVCSPESIQAGLKNGS